MQFRMTPIRFCLLVILAEWIGIAAWQFPWAIDSPVNREQESRSFYVNVYSEKNSSTIVEAKYEQIAEQAHRDWKIRENIAGFVSRNALENARVLDVGSGRGDLQDAVKDYTGLDISRTAARFYHKSFVVGTATAMPFKDGEFDAVWSIWVLEHIPNPEAALNEIRRVVKPGGLLYLLPAWDCVPWAAQGLDLRPYRELGFSGRLEKASIPIQDSVFFKIASKLPVFLIRSLVSAPTRLHYRRLRSNYDQYWEADSDAVNSLDRTEVARWFTSRGDQLINYSLGAGGPLEIRVSKSNFSNPGPVNE